MGAETVDDVHRAVNFGMSTHSRVALRWTGIVLGSLVVLALVVLALFDWNRFKHPIERIASAKSGRSVRIAGDLDVHIWSLTPTVTVHGLTLGDPPWEANRPMATIDRLEVHLKLLPLLKGQVILPRVALFKPDVYLHQDKGGRANWTFENKAPTNEPASRPSKLPAIQDLLIQDGKLTLIDDVRHLTVKGTMQADEQKTTSDPTPFRIQGTGTINDQPFRINVAGGPLMHIDPEHPYPFDLQITAGDLRVESKGRALKPFDLAWYRSSLEPAARLPTTPPALPSGTAISSWQSSLHTLYQVPAVGQTIAKRGLSTNSF